MVKPQDQGTQHLKPKVIEARIEQLTLKSKKDRIAGFELADLIVSSIGRHAIGKESK